MAALKIYRFDSGSCNGCDIEVVSATSERYNTGDIAVVEAPEDANVLVVTGVVTAKTERHLKEAYEKLQEPKLVVAVGTCAVSSGVFDGSYSVREPADRHVPVRAYLNGCPPSPQAIAAALSTVAGRSSAEWPAPADYRGLPVVDEEKCTACGACATSCPANAIEIVDGEAARGVRYLHERCISCATCRLVCPEDAVRLLEKRHEPNTRKESRSEARVPLVTCPVCGKSHITRPQLVAIKRRLEENERIRVLIAEFENRLKLSRECKMQRLREGKLTLYSLGYGSPRPDS